MDRKSKVWIAVLAVLLAAALTTAILFKLKLDDKETQISDLRDAQYSDGYEIFELQSKLDAALKDRQELETQLATTFGGVTAAPSQMPAATDEPEVTDEPQATEEAAATDEPEATDAGNDAIIAEYQAEIDKAQGEIEELNGQLEDMNGRVATLTEELDAANAAKAEAEGELETLRAAEDEIKAMLDEANAGNDDLSGRLDAASTAHADASAKLDEANATIEDLNAQIAAAQQERAEIEASLDGETSRAAQLESDLTAAQAELADVKGQLESALSENESMSAELASAQSDVNAYRQKYAADDGQSHASAEFGEGVQVAADGVTAVYEISNTQKSSSSLVFTLEIAGESVYTSKPIAPGETVTEFTLDAPLTSGTYEGEIKVTTKASDGSDASSMTIPVNVVVE